MVEELICAGIQCVMQNGEKVLEGILQLAQNFSFGPVDKHESNTQD